jgi:hypothetical protein
MSAGLFGLLDDIAALARIAAASVDDVGAAAGRASAKAAGVVVDDTAVTPQYLQGSAAERELPIIKKIAIGSLRNKLLFILPAAVLLGQFLPQDFKVADLSLAEFGRKEIRLAEHEMPGLMAMRERVRRHQAAQGRAHRRLAAHDHPDRRADRDPGRARRRGALGQLQHLLHPGPRRRRVVVAPNGTPRTRRASRCSPGRARRSRSTGGAPSRS